MTAIKICGITRPEDAAFAAGCGADALGFIFYDKSPRCVAPEKAKRIIETLPRKVAARKIGSGGVLSSGRDRISAVGVFVNRPVGEVDEIAAFCGLDLIQLHGDESADYCAHFPPVRLIKAFAPTTEADLERLGGYPVRAILIDARDPVRYGGTGRTSDWTLAAKAARLAPVILAGGLHAGNIAAAIEAVAPEAVDLCSGVEASPGVKDHGKLAAAITRIRNEDRRHE